jgi:hypothetical protein
LEGEPQRPPELCAFFPLPSMGDLRFSCGSVSWNPTSRNLLPVEGVRFADKPSSETSRFRDAGAPAHSRGIRGDVHLRPASEWRVIRPRNHLMHPASTATLSVTGHTDFSSSLDQNIKSAFESLDNVVADVRKELGPKIEEGGTGGREKAACVWIYGVGSVYVRATPKAFFQAVAVGSVDGGLLPKPG